MAPSPLWLHPVHAKAASRGGLPEPLRFDKGEYPQRRGAILRQLLKDAVGAVMDQSDSRISRWQSEAAFSVSLEGKQLRVWSHSEELCCSIPLLLSDVVALQLREEEGVAHQVLAVAPNVPPAGEVMHELSATEEEAWILCSSLGRDLLPLLSVRGAVRWDWLDAFIECDELGKGSCGIVFRARAKDPESLPQRLRGDDGFAVKVLSLSALDELSLRNEVLCLASAGGHPNICGFVGVFCSAGEVPAEEEGEDHEPAPVWRIALELLPGGDLFDLVSHSGPLDEPSAIEMTLGLLSGLTHLHSLRLVHRDVKAENVLFDSNRRPALADFGIACELDDFAALQCRVGSPGYVAPEVVLAQTYDQQVDVFGAGAVMYFSLRGKLVFEGDTITQVLHRTVRCKISFQSSKFASCSGSLLSFLKSLLAKEPAQRPTARCAFAAAWVLAPSQVREGDIAKEAVAAMSTTLSLSPPASPAMMNPPRKGAPLLIAPSSSFNASTGVSSQNRSTIRNQVASDDPSLVPSRVASREHENIADAFAASSSFRPVEDAAKRTKPEPKEELQLPEQAEEITLEAPRTIFGQRKTQSSVLQSGAEKESSKKSFWRAVMGWPSRLFTSAKVSPGDVSPELMSISPESTQRPQRAVVAPQQTSEQKRWGFGLFPRRREAASHR
mmetsp:Transcript_3206/g.7537  ORF Transcript_3206/g.7537 Transcript_3206/m.7537 type:complete len:668 (+) Transcript_3206:92-2095(+)